MARKKLAEGGGNNAPWLNTFADLMNLLLCFFVLLFALSDVDGEKFEKVSISMANSIGVFTGGGSAIGEGQLISSGMSQLNELDKLFESMGKSSEGESTPKDSSGSSQGTNDSQSSENVMQGQEGATGEQSTEGVEGTEATQGGHDTEETQGADSSTSNSGNESIEEALARVQDEMVSVTSGMYDQVSDLSNQYNLEDYMELSIDSEYRFVQLTLKGSVLFDSGSADIKGAAKPILSKIGELLKKFKGCNVEIIGHTDNVPMSSSEYKDNNWLSTARALNASEYLINVCGMDPITLKYSGRGEYEPVSSNSSEEGRTKNRRIEIRIYNQYSGR